MSDFSDRDIDTTIHQFEAAVSARPFEIPGIKVHRILVALDRSNQDGAVLAVSRAVAARLRAKLILTSAHEEGAPDVGEGSYLSEVTAQLVSAGFEAEAFLSEPSGRAFSQILDAALAQRCDLIAFPSPYQEDFQDLGRASVGTTTDMLLHRRTGPLLIIRKPAERAREQLEDVIVPLGLLSEKAEKVAAWALELVRANGVIHLIGTVDEELMHALGHLVGASFQAEEVDEAKLAGLEQPEAAGFIGAIQRRAAERGIGCRVTVERGQLVSAVAEFANAQSSLIVVGCGSACAASDYQRTLALIRESENPVLVV